MKTRVRVLLSPILIIVTVVASLLSGCDGETTPVSVPVDTPAAPMLATGAPSGSIQANARIYEEVTRILNSLRTTSYSHTTRVDENKGDYNVDCSGLVDYVLKRVAMDNYQKIVYTNAYRPYAEDFYHYFTGLDADHLAAEGDWCRIENLADAMAGDIIVYEYNQATKDSKGTTGHVMIFASAPMRQDNGEYMVWVIDSANSGHGSDTRTGDGVGKGRMWFGVDGNGTPVYYRWSKATGDKHSQGLLGITIGRAG